MVKKHQQMGRLNKLYRIVIGVYTLSKYFLTLPLLFFLIGRLETMYELTWLVTHRLVELQLTTCKLLRSELRTWKLLGSQLTDSQLEGQNFCISQYYLMLMTKKRWDEQGLYKFVGLIMFTVILNPGFSK